MAVRTCKELYDSLIKKGFQKVPENRITGDDYQEWCKQRFVQQVDKCENYNSIELNECVEVYDDLNTLSEQSMWNFNNNTAIINQDSSFFNFTFFQEDVA